MTKAIYNAIRVAREGVQNRYVEDHRRAHGHL